MGASTKGKFAILVNFHEQKPEFSFSRGSLPVSYLQSDLDAQDWKNETDAEHGETLQNVGGFTMLFGELKLTNGQLEPLRVMSNRQAPTALLTPEEPTVSISNGALTDPTWPKTTQCIDLFKPLLHKRGDEFVHGLFEVMTTSTITELVNKDDLRRTIYVPHNDSGYETRTQTIVLVSRDGTVTWIEKDGPKEEFKIPL